MTSTSFSPGLSENRLRIADSAPGFMPLDEAHALHDTAATLLSKPDSVGIGVEIGTYCGKSTVFLGAAAEPVDALIVTVDHHRGSEEHQPGWEYHDTELVDPHSGLLDTAARFRQTMFDAELESTVLGLLAPSTAAARVWGREVDFVFIDGGHSMEAAQNDYDGWARWVRPGGALLIHDVFPDPADGGRPPYEIYCQARASGRFVEASAHGSLRVLTRIA
ncbi:class I SAM-dependent methyltransferase [Gordonia hydrophobica]|uniref:Class I SAM-dependent methyltransferase n=1 Tax=Gordonia hydrophobica TaxID=40516 RepID=A0ABZ2TW27_9ACTN|nr:class I SAM-dependent methyltransferase [Gordonia hydrophobica]MBM7365893.1 putative O-methyltransferase YrrM [Gordonia hydrophobica]